MVDGEKVVRKSERAALPTDLPTTARESPRETFLPGTPLFASYIVTKSAFKGRQSTSKHVTNERNPALLAGAGIVTSAFCRIRRSGDCGQGESFGEISRVLRDAVCNARISALSLGGVACTRTSLLEAPSWNER